MAPHISAASSLDWTTPLYIIDKVRAAFGGRIGLDPCSNPSSKVAADVNYMLPDNDGLKDSWDFKTIFVNPPYGRCHVHRDTKVYVGAATYKALSAVERKNYVSTTIADWVRRCADANRAHGSEVIALIPAAIDTKHWQNIIFKTADAVCFANGRIKFDLPGDQSIKNNAPPMGTALIYWGDNVRAFANAFDHVGFIFSPKMSDAASVLVRAA